MCTKLVRRDQLVNCTEAQFNGQFRVQLAAFNQRISGLCSSLILDLGKQKKSAAFDLLKVQQLDEKLNALFSYVQKGLGEISLESDLEQSFLEKIEHIFHQNRAKVKGECSARFEAQLKVVEQIVLGRVEGHLAKIKVDFNSHLAEKQQLIDEQLMRAAGLVDQLVGFLDTTLSEKLKLSRIAIFGTSFTEMDGRRARMLNTYKKVKRMVSEALRRRVGDFERQIQETKQQIIRCRDKAVEAIEASLATFEERYLKGEAQRDTTSAWIIEIMSEISRQYLDSTRHYKNNAELALKTYVIGLQTSLRMFIEQQDVELELLIAKIEVVKRFLEGEIEIVLKHIQSKDHKLLKASPLAGRWTSNAAFDGSLNRAYGDISKIVVHADWWVDGLTLKYRDAADSVTYGKIGDDNHVLLSGERIRKVVLKTGAFPHATNGLDSIAFHTDQAKYGPYGATHGHPSMGTQVVGFGQDYYLCAVKGQLATGRLGKIGFVFARDFSKVLSKDLSGKIAAVEKMLKQAPSLAYDAAKKAKLEKTLRQAGLHRKVFKLDPYAVLGVASGTPLSEIEKAYKRLVKRFHPDRHPRFKELYEYRMKNITSAWSAIKAALQSK